MIDIQAIDSMKQHLLAGPEPITSWRKIQDILKDLSFPVMRRKLFKELVVQTKPKTQLLAST
jgi:hypothetical protein